MWVTFTSTLQVTELLEQSAPKRPAPPAAPEPNGEQHSSAAQDLPNGDNAPSAAAGAAPTAENGTAAPHADDMETDVAASTATAAAGPVHNLSAEEEAYLERFGRLKGILDGTMSISHYLEFLYSHNHADLQVRACPEAQQSPVLEEHPLSNKGSHCRCIWRLVSRQGGLGMWVLRVACSWELPDGPPNICADPEERQGGLGGAQQRVAQRHHLR